LRPRFHGLIRVTSYGRDSPGKRLTGYACVSTAGQTLDSQLDAASRRFDLSGIVKRIVDAKAQFRSLAEPWADAGTSTGRLMLAVLGGLADVERDLIRTRTAEGRSRAKARGKAMGRRPSAGRMKS
jgi:Resolvase, N terminal domain